MKLLLTTVAAIVLATTSFAADIGVSAKMKVAENEATDKYEEARIKIQHHFNAKNAYEIILTSGTTHSINMVASGFASLLKKDV